MKRIKSTRKFIDVRDLEYYFEDVLNLRVEDTKKNRFTDCYLSIAVRNGRVTFLLTHEKGYPSENKGLNEKQITANWKSNDLPNSNKTA